MKKKILILFLGLILSCNSNEKLEGTWIGAYSYSDNSNSDIQLPIRSVVTFKNDKYFIRNFKYDYRSENDFEKGTFDYNGNKIIYNSNKENIDIVDLINNDSLIIKGVDGANNSVFKKLKKSTKSKSENIKLIGKRFLLNSKKYNDTLTFANDTLVIKSSDKSRTPGNHWERIKHNGFDILFMEFDIPFVIRKETNGKITLTGFHQKRHDVILIEL